MYQLTDPVPNRNEIWNWKANTDAALILLAQKKQLAKNKLDAHPGYTDTQLRLETYAKWNAGFYHVWQNNQWIEDPSVICGCNGLRNGQTVGPPLGPCTHIAQCFADAVHSNE